MDEERRRRQCGDKRRRTEAEAKVAAEEQSVRYNELFVAYLCPFCDTWHIGHKPEKFFGEVGNDTDLDLSTWTIAQDARS